VRSIPRLESLSFLSRSVCCMIGFVVLAPDEKCAQVRALLCQHWDMLRSGVSGTGTKTAQQLRARLLKHACDANIHVQGVTEMQA
jgi:hypothetical protein